MSNRKTFEKIQREAESVLESLRELMETMQEAHENTPENLINSQQYEDRDSRLSALADFEYNLDELTEYDWTNP